MIRPPRAFTKALNDAILQSGLTKRQVSRAVMCDPSHMYNVLAGRRHCARDQVVSLLMLCDKSVTEINSILVLGGYLPVIVMWDESMDALNSTLARCTPERAQELSNQVKALCTAALENKQ